MVKLFRIELGEEKGLWMRGNFIEVVDRKAHSAAVCFLDGKGREIDLPYDVQGAILEVFRALDCENRSAVSWQEECRTTRSALQELQGRIEQLKEDKGGQVATGNMTLGGFVAWAERVKGLWIKEER